MNKEQLINKLLQYAFNSNQDKLAERMNLLPVGLEIILSRIVSGYRDFDTIESLAKALDLKITFSLEKICH